MAFEICGGELDDAVFVADTAERGGPLNAERERRPDSDAVVQCVWGAAEGQSAGGGPSVKPFFISFTWTDMEIRSWWRKIKREWKRRYGDGFKHER